MTTFVADRFAGKTALITGTGSGIFWRIDRVASW
jgi:NAD(P)-dependent dehydrogenase (short-subunit alcohol dehydrogenase family)